MSFAVHTVPTFKFPHLPEGFRWSVEQIGLARVNIQLLKTVSERSGWLKKPHFIDQLVAEEVVDYLSEEMCIVAQRISQQHCK